MNAADMTVAYDVSCDVMRVVVPAAIFEHLGRRRAAQGFLSSPHPIEIVDELHREIGAAFLFMGYEAVMWRALESSSL